MAKRTGKRVGLIYVKEIKPGCWRASWSDPTTRQHIRRLLPATDYKEAKAEAAKINAKVSCGHGFDGRMRGGAGGLTIGEAIKEAVAHTAANPVTRAGYLYSGNTFIDYRDNHCPHIQAWSDVKPGIIQNYIEFCRTHTAKTKVKNAKPKVVSFDTIRLRLFVLRMISKYMVRVHGIADPTVGIPLRRHLPTQAEEQGADSILPARTYHELVSRLEAVEPMVHVWALLQGGLGLRGLEACYLIEDDFDPAAQVLKIRSNDSHVVKNKASLRTVPLPPTVSAALARWIAGMKVRNPDGYLFRSGRNKHGRKRGKSVAARLGTFTSDGQCQRWHKGLQAACAANPDRGWEELKLPHAFTPRKLRASFITSIRSIGIDADVLQHFVGHTPASVMAAHYHKINLEQLQVVSTAAEELITGTARFAPRQNAAIHCIKSASTSGA